MEPYVTTGNNKDASVVCYHTNLDFLPMVQAKVVIKNAYNGS